ncbi:deubiquitinase OTUD6B isoform X2 [Rhipicephalus sanguineus]|uniref:deubiquitinase OTUD6B isoform X2 n=1 Tax=Rhipicephalus sanguineus TaxID=34632 RepID=UPI001892D7DD|nr:deubiquitinase OTUD6B isoform X2 [Rhipicephalus sanguineus]
MAESGQMRLSHDELLQAHRKERKELQAKIQSLKHSVPKGDKKRKKDVAAEVAVLEAELEKKHKKDLEEFAALQSDGVASDQPEVDDVINELDAASLHEPSMKQGKASKAEKRREKKRQKEVLREKEIAEQEVENQFLPRAVEERELRGILGKLGLTIYEIPSDGNCMYKAMEHQLGLFGIMKSMSELRQETAKYMLSHSEEFLPFLTSRKSGDMMTAEEYEDYCLEVSSTTAWGGQVELKALSHACKVPITIVQAAGPSIEIGTEYNAKPILLSYHRCLYEMGEHYNSLVPKRSEVDEGNWAGLQV